MQEFKGRTAVVTGGASGIGLATARALGRQGMRLVIADIEDAALEAARKVLVEEGFEALAVRTDVSRAEDVERLAQTAHEHYGAIHVVHNNAGVVKGGSIDDLSLADWEWVLGVDLWGVIHGVRVFLPYIREAGEGHIVNTASSAGLYAQPNIGPYNVAKFGVVALTETLARELEAESSEIGASVLCPGLVATRILTSDRNRPGEDAGAGPQAGGEPDAGAGEFMAQNGLSADVVADQVVAAIREKNFWIVTHPGWFDVLKDRVAAMGEDGRLTSGFGG